jgi:hypothetical protein
MRMQQELCTDKKNVFFVAIAAVFALTRLRSDPAGKQAQTILTQLLSSSDAVEPAVDDSYTAAMATKKTIRLRACLRNVSDFIQCALPEGNHLFWSASSFCFLAM